MPRKEPSPEVLALIYLRSKGGWSKKELASRLGLPDVGQLYRYERGEKELRREELESFAAQLGYPLEAVDALLFIHSLISHEPREVAGPLALTPRDRRQISRAVLSTGWSVAEAVGNHLVRRMEKEKAEAARREAEELWNRMKTASREEQRDLVVIFPEFRSWALAVRVCEASVRAAADKPRVALELAALASWIADRVPGDEGWRSRVQGYAWAHIANARRVANDLAEADRAFARAWELWRAGAPTDSELLQEWRLLDLEASLRREERRFTEALKLLEQAIEASVGNKAATGRVLLNKEFTLEQMGDTQGSLAVLMEATPFVEAAGDPRLLFALRFKAANNLYHLKRFEQAAELLPQTRELAVQLGNELDLIRLLWLEMRVEAGRGRAGEALAGLKQVRHDFTTLQLPYDAALSSLDLAVLWLEIGRTAEVQEIALAMAWIFRAQGIDREALAALSLFRDAVQKETVTAELTRSVIAEIERIRRSVSRPEDRRRDRV